VAFPCLPLPTQLVLGQSASRTGDAGGLTQQGAGCFVLTSLHFFSGKYSFQMCWSFSRLPQEDLNWAMSLEQLAASISDIKKCVLVTADVVNCSCL